MDNINKMKDPYRTSRLLYIIEAALEYFISILVGTTYLAKLTTSIGISDGVTGVLTSFVALGSSFQIFALLIAGKRPVKRFVVPMHLFNELCFTFLYAVPLFNIPRGARTVVFVVLLLAGNIVHNVINAPKINWLMGLVDDGQRGTFTAKKEIVSLLSGMAVSLAMGTLIDTLEARGELKLAFVITGITVFALTVIHSLSLIFAKERCDEPLPEQKIGAQLRSALTDRSTHVLIPLFVLWNVATYVTTPFYGTYQLGELGFSMTEVAILSAVYAVLRAVVSVPMGKFADKYSFVSALNICFSLMIVGFGLNIFAGKAFYIAYYLIYAVAMAGINSGTINLIYDYTPRANRTGALAIKNTVSGIIGFVATLAARPLVDYVQANGNRFLGIEGVYAQQVLSAIGAILTVAVVIYLNVAVKRLYRPHEVNDVLEDKHLPREAGGES